MFVTVTPQLVRGIPIDPACAASSSTGFIRVGREPGGRLREWARTAMLYREDCSVDLQLQLHAMRFIRWDAAGVWLSGVERHWRRKDRDEYPQLWLISFAESRRVAIYLLRSGGERRPLDEVRRSAPRTGSIEAAVDGRAPAPRALFRASKAGEESATLHSAQLQRWDGRGLVIAGLERAGQGPAAADVWQSWFVTFPGPVSLRIDVGERAASAVAA